MKKNIDKEAKKDSKMVLNCDKLKKAATKKMTVKAYEIIIFSFIVVFITAFFSIIIINELRDDGSKEKVVKSNNSLKEVEEVYDLINSSYYKDIDQKKLIDGAIDGMLESLGDPHTSYFNEEETNSFNDIMNGTYEGIGAEISMNNDKKIIVHSVFKNSPAAKAGLKFNDIIVEVNGKSTEGITTTETVALIKDASKPVANIIVERDGERLEFNIEKEMIVIESVESDIYKRNNKKIGYVLINNFANNTYEQFKENIQELEKNNISGLIIDVRNNSGGYLHAVTSMLDMFIEKDKIMYQIQDKNSTVKYKSKSDESRNYPIVVLMNEASASASEILAISLKESYGAELIGTNTFGKGTVQVTKNLSDGSMIKYTIQKWLSPDGNWINDVGVTPTIKVEESEAYLSNPIFENDNQLQTALDEIIKH